MALLDFYEKIFDGVESTDNFKVCLENLAFWADGRHPHMTWLKLPAMLNDNELEEARSWFSKELKELLEAGSISVLYFFLREFRDSVGREYSDLGVSFYPQDSDNWPYTKDCVHSKSDLDSGYLKNLGVVCKGSNKPDFLSSGGYIGFSLAYASLIAKELCKNEDIIHRSMNKNIRVAVGFTSGDILEIMHISNGEISFVRKYA